MRQEKLCKANAPLFTARSEYAARTKHDGARIGCDGCFRGHLCRGIGAKIGAQGRRLLDKTYGAAVYGHRAQMDDPWGWSHPLRCRDQRLGSTHYGGCVPGHAIHDAANALHCRGYGFRSSRLDRAILELIVTVHWGLADGEYRRRPVGRSKTSDDFSANESIVA